MKLPKLAINNSAFTITIFTLMILVGLVAYFTMPRSEDPQFDLPITLIEVIYPGASPKDIENLVVDPLEQEIAEIENIKKIESQVKNDGARLNIEFNYGVDADRAFFKIKQAVSTVKPSLPAGIQTLQVIKATPTDVAIMQVALASSPVDYKTMEVYAKRLEKRFETVAGVKRASIWGYPAQIVEIDLNASLLKQYNIAVNQVVQLLQQRGLNITPGFVEARSRRFNVKASGNFSQLSELNETVIVERPDATIRLQDIAQIYFGQQQPNYLAYYQNQPVIFITVEQSAHSNIFQVTQALQNIIAEFQQSMPKSLTLHTLFTQADSVDHRVHGFFVNLMQGLVVVALMSLLFLGLREAVVVSLAIPFSFLMAIGWLEMMGFGLQQMSIVGLIIALGLLVDNAIVVTESIDIEKRHSNSLIQASSNGAAKVGWAITSGTATTLLAFLPMLLLASSTGDFLRSMPITVVLVLVASLLVALTLTPMLASKLFKQHGQTKFKTLAYYCNHFAEHFYAVWLKRLLAYKYWVLLLAVVGLVAMMSVFSQVGVSLFPKAEKPMLLVDVELVPNSSLHKTNYVSQKVADYLQKQPEIKDVAVNVGNANPRIYYNEIPKRGVAYYAQLLVLLDDDNTQNVPQLVHKLRAEFSTWSDADIRVKEFTQGPVTDQAVTIRLFSNSLADLTAEAKKLEQFMHQTSGLVNINNPIGKSQTIVKLAIDYDKAAMQGISVQQIDSTLQTLLLGQVVAQFSDDNGESYPVMVKQRDHSIDALKHIELLNNQGQHIPLSSFITPKLASGQADFFHYQKLRMAKVSADVASGYSVNELTLKVQHYLQQQKLPQGMRFELGGEEENRQRSFGGLTKILIITAVGIMAILVLQFKSFLQPLIIFSSIPFAMAGSAIGLYLFGLSFSMMAFIGLISLFGIVVNDAILLVDTANQQLKMGKDKLSAVLEASYSRFTPIVLTTLTTIGGLIPLTLWGGDLWQPLGVVIISGMVVAGITSVIIVPLLTLVFTRES